MTNATLRYKYLRQYSIFDTIAVFISNINALQGGLPHGRSKKPALRQ